MNNYPVNIRLTKLKTLENAEYPQEHKYPSGTTVREGLMFEHTLPKIGESFSVNYTKLLSKFITSEITNIEKIDDKISILTTLNSKYKLEII